MHYLNLLGGLTLAAVGGVNIYKANYMLAGVWLALACSCFVIDLSGLKKQRKPGDAEKKVSPGWQRIATYAFLVLATIFFILTIWQDSQ